MGGKSIAAGCSFRAFQRRALGGVVDNAPARGRTLLSGDGTHPLRADTMAHTCKLVSDF